MISVLALKLMLKNFDCIDQCVSKRLLRKRPWTEPSLTSLLCDLFDNDSQTDEAIFYSTKNLNEDLMNKEGLVDVSFEIDTHEYPPSLERWVTQSDLGLILKYNDLVFGKSWSKAWLLQAKRCLPWKNSPIEYSVTSRFGAINKNQHQRMKKIEDFVNEKFILYLLYCPRAGSLPATTGLELKHLRNFAVAGNIFDYSLGQQLREDLLSDTPTVDAGMFVACMDDCPGCLGEVYESIFSKCTPLSWFLLSQFLEGVDASSYNEFGLNCDGGISDRAHGVVSGEREIVEDVIKLFEAPNISFSFLPPHTISINLTIGRNIKHSSAVKE